MEIKTILVSGGNRGIGFEVCRQLSGQGHRVILGSRDPEKGNTALKRLGSGVQCVELDMIHTDRFAEIHSIIDSQYGKLDVLINNAAITGSSKGFDKAPVNEIKNVLQTNCLGAIELTRQLLPLIKKSADGRIINISSGMGAVNDGGSGYAAYRLSKAAINAFTVFLADDLSGTDIRVNAVCPGWVRTDMGGRYASRSVEKGAETIIWLATETFIPNGKFLRDKKVINW